MKLQFDRSDMVCALSAYAGIAPGDVEPVDSLPEIVATAEAEARSTRRRRSAAKAGPGTSMADDMTDKPRRTRKPRQQRVGDEPVSTGTGGDQ